jgi:hypothetical protein
MAMTTSELYRELGFLGNCDEALTIDYVKTEIVNKAEQGDSNSIFKLNQIIRHSDNAEVVAYARAQLERLDPATKPAETVAKQDV